MEFYFLAIHILFDGGRLSEGNAKWRHLQNWPVTGLCDRPRTPQPPLHPVSYTALPLQSVADPDPHIFGPPGSTSQRYGSGYFYHAKIVRKWQDPDPLVRSMDPRIRIHPRMSWIRNTAPSSEGGGVGWVDAKGENQSGRCGVGSSDFDIFFINSICFMFLVWSWILRLIYKKTFLEILNGFYLIWPFILQKK